MLFCCWGGPRLTDPNSDRAKPALVAPAPQTRPGANTVLAVLGGLLIILSLISNGYLWHLWRQDQAVQHALAQLRPELLELKNQVQSLSSDLDQLKKTVESYHTAQEALRQDLGKLREQQNTDRHWLQQQLQKQQAQSVQQQRQQQRNPVTW